MGQGHHGWQGTPWHCFRPQRQWIQTSPSCFDHTRYHIQSFPIWGLTNPALSAQGPKTATAVKEAIEKAKTSENRHLDSVSNRVARNLTKARVHQLVSTLDVVSDGVS